MYIYIYITCICTREPVAPNPHAEGSVRLLHSHDFRLGPYKNMCCLCEIITVCRRSSNQIF